MHNIMIACDSYQLGGTFDAYVIGTDGPNQLTCAKDNLMQDIAEGNDLALV